MDYNTQSNRIHIASTRQECQLCKHLLSLRYHFLITYTTKQCIMLHELREQNIRNRSEAADIVKGHRGTTYTILELQGPNSTQTIGAPTVPVLS